MNTENTTMTQAQQPETLVFADNRPTSKSDDLYQWAIDAEDLIRAQHARIAELEAQLSAIGAGGVEAPAAPVSTYVEVRECPDCGHVGINDTDGSKAACNTCEWYGDSPREDKCPGCNRVGTMSAACPKCGSRTLLLAETHLLVAHAQADARDAARYRWLRDNDWRNDEKMEPVIRLHLNAIWDEKIDAAMAAQSRKEKGIEQ